MSDSRNNGNEMAGVNWGLLGLRYLAAVLVASGCFAVLLVAPTLWAIWGKVSLAIILSDFVMIPIMFALTAVLAVPLTLPWTLAAVTIAVKVRTNAYSYWTTAGLAAGFAAATLFVWIAHASFPSVGDDGSEVSFTAEWLRVSAISSIAGAAGGFVFRWINGSLSFSLAYERRLPPHG